MADPKTKADDKKEAKPKAAKEAPKAESPKPEAEKAPKAEAPKEDKKEFDASSLTADQKKVLELVEKMTALELADLVKAIEDKFGVSAAAPVAAVAAAPAGGAAEEAEEKSTFNVVLKASGANKIATIKVVKEITGLGLTEAKALVDEAPKPVKEGVGKSEADEIVAQLKEAGAEVELE